MKKLNEIAKENCYIQCINEDERKSVIVELAKLGFKPGVSYLWYSSQLIVIVSADKKLFGLRNECKSRNIPTYPAQTIIITKQ